MHMRVGSNLNISAKLLDLGLKGMAVLSAYDFTLNSIVVIKFTLVDLYTSSEQSKSMEVNGVVCYNNCSGEKQHRTGISFIKMSKFNQQLIFDFVNKGTVNE
ncbi:MAG: hypothetical protein DRP78_01275 [Candidatus Omnitrophota bacterium]|nr:MAG: hypothetical protein DRP78_01275 [Candidatus Omnitrophota bacterium]